MHVFAFRYIFLFLLQMELGASGSEGCVHAATTSAGGSTKALPRTLPITSRGGILSATFFLREYCEAAPGKRGKLSCIEVDGMRMRHGDAEAAAGHERGRCWKKNFTTLHAGKELTLKQYLRSVVYP